MKYLSFLISLAKKRSQSITFYAGGRQGVQGAGTYTHLVPRGGWVISGNSDSTQGTK